MSAPASQSMAGGPSALHRVRPASFSPGSAGLCSSSLASILDSFRQDGSSNAGLLQLILAAKVEEDRRLTSLDMVRVEELRAHNLAMSRRQQASCMSCQSSRSPSSPPSSSTPIPPWGHELSAGAPMLYPQPQVKFPPSCVPRPLPVLLPVAKRPLVAPLVSLAPRLAPLITTQLPSHKRYNSAPSSSDPRPKKASKLDKLANECQLGSTSTPDHDEVMLAIRAKVARNQHARTSSEAGSPVVKLPSIDMGRADPMDYRSRTGSSSSQRSPSIHSGSTSPRHSFAANYSPITATSAALAQVVMSPGAPGTTRLLSAPVTSTPPTFGRPGSLAGYSLSRG